MFVTCPFKLFMLEFFISFSIWSVDQTSIPTQISIPLFTKNNWKVGALRANKPNEFMSSSHQNATVILTIQNTNKTRHDDFTDCTIRQYQESLDFKQNEKQRRVY